MRCRWLVRLGRVIFEVVVTFALVYAIHLALAERVKSTHLARVTALFIQLGVLAIAILYWYLFWYH